MSSGHMIRAEEKGRAAKLIFGLLLVGIAVGAVVIGLARESVHTAPPPVPSTAPGPSWGVVTVYYFHGDTRCNTCREIESRTVEIVQRRFAGPIEVGMLRFASVNFDDPDERHFRADYNLSFGTVLVQGAGGAKPWESLSDVWTLIHGDPAAFEAYLVEHIQTMLDAAG